MKVEITNGALLHRLWPDSGCPEMLGMVQYTQDAEALANIMIERDIKHQLGSSIYIITCVYSGKMTIIRPEPKDTTK